MREVIADSYFQRNGYTSLEGKFGSGNGFDGVYIKGNQVIINEVKPLNADGSINLSAAKGNLPAQMSDAWIKSRIQMLEQGTPAQQEAARTIQAAIDKGLLTRVVTGVNSKSLTIIKLK